MRSKAKRERERVKELHHCGHVVEEKDYALVQSLVCVLV
jgi:hypothetical protein